MPTSTTKRQRRQVHHESKNQLIELERMLPSTPQTGPDIVETGGAYDVEHAIRLFESFFTHYSELERKILVD